MNTTMTTAMQGAMFTAVTALFLVGLSSVSCGKAEETFDDFDSNVSCNEYCDKKADCNDEQPTAEENRACVDGCRDAIEDECGNEYQASANDKIGECVDMGCTEFWACMKYDAAPECFGFVDRGSS